MHFHFTIYVNFFLFSGLSFEKRRISRIRGYPLKHAKVAAFGSTRKAGLAAENDPNVRSIMDSGVRVATIFGKTWDFQNLAMIRDTVAYLKSRGLEVIYDAEHFFDGYKANPAYALQTVKAAQAGGASTVVLCDTNGGSLPSEARTPTSPMWASAPSPTRGGCMSAP